MERSHNRASQLIQVRIAQSRIGAAYPGIQRNDHHGSQDRQDNGESCTVRHRPAPV
jgi:hypothetical protein